MLSRFGVECVSTHVTDHRAPEMAVMRSLHRESITGSCGHTARELLISIRV